MISAPGIVPRGVGTHGLPWLRSAASAPERRSPGTRWVAGPVARRLLQKYDGYCEALFLELVSEAPVELAALLTGDRLKPSLLTFAAEVAGRMADQALARHALLPLLERESAFVREGAVYGLSALLPDDAIEQALRHAASDPSEAAREAVAEALDRQR